jgi:hypothetical protein
MSFPASLDDTLSLLQTWASNFQRNATASLTNLTPKDVIRIIIVVGAYVLILRPQLLRFAARNQARQHAEREPSSTDDSQAVGISALDPDSDSDDAKGNTRTGEWGRGARLRQRAFVRKALEDSGEADDSDEEIRQFLVD